MQSVGSFKAKTHFSSLLQQVEHGEEIIITKHGRPIAKLVPVEGLSQESVHQSIEKLLAFGEAHTLGDLNWKTLRDEGRK